MLLRKSETILPLFILINFYIAPNLIYAFSKPWQGIIVKLENPGIWEFLPGFIIGLLTFIIDGFMIVYFLGRKGFCRFICPWGAFLKFPNSLAMFKVRNTGACIQSGNCTNNCPVGIDVSYEINNYDKVTNANCTSCLICTEGCQANAISYKWKNPFNEDFKLKYYSTNNQNMYRIESIKNNFIGIHAYDYFILILILLFGFSIDGLYGMGHFLSFGIATIFSIQVFFLWKNKINKYIKYFITCFIVLSFFWNGLIKFSIWNGLNLYKNNDYLNAIIHLERAVIMYPKSIGRFHIILSQMYLDNDNLIKAKYHALKALSINPDHNAPVELLNIINGKGD